MMGAPTLSPARHVYAIMGLPFDAVTMDQAVDAVHEAVRKRRRLFISTPNLNFVVAARHDATLRRTVLNSDLILPDGMSVVWVARLLGIPVTERVSGAGLFEALWQITDKPPIRVFFFGGPDGVAREACERVNLTGAGICCVGFLSPGFGSVDEMSSARVIEQINAAEPDFLVVSLGAAKGQAWIERNLSRLNVPVVSHLGAVVNFVAGRVKRAPVWIQRLDLEWAWRIKEEPALARRYASDAWAFAAILVREVLPCALFARQTPRATPADWLETISGDASTPALRLAPLGDPETLVGCEPLAAAFGQVAVTGRPLRIELDALLRMNSQAAGKLMQIVGAAMKRNVALEFVSSRPEIKLRGQRWFAIPELGAPNMPADAPAFDRAMGVPWQSPTIGPDASQAAAQRPDDRGGACGRL